MSPRPHFPASRASIIQPLSSRPHSGFGGLQHPLRTPLLSMATLPSAAVQLSKPNASCHSLPFAAIRRTVSPASSSLEAYPVQLRAEHLSRSRRIPLQLRTERSQRFAPHICAASRRASFNASRRISCSFVPSISFGPYPTRLRSCPRFPGSGFCIGGRRVCHAPVPSRLYRRHATRRERTGCFEFHLRSFVIPLAGTSTAFGNFIFPNVRG